ncbi:quaternary ammonium compound-resistance protein SugE [Arthrobacter pigmenti]|uniref:Quaternary ammonium compound-resistance protein SugE n=1 Tax=Arthrobacter pigmenti TaxID=271432 RepID=A0A846RS56_9MICC|nr:hypothetical protein [Arthrobacter pigmenti]NJC22997.1 quaternary ammonium compound-resistance protein SugE [Arthrobacter pigmenti]
MVSLIVVTGVAITLGFGVWFADRRHHRYGLFLLPGVCLGSALLMWIILQFAGLGYHPELFWLAWLLPLVAALALTVVAAWWFGRHREKADADAMTAILKQR